MAAASGKRKGLAPSRWEIWVKCDYCHSVSSGANCANCGAPLPDIQKPAPPSNEFPRVNLDGRTEYERRLAEWELLMHPNRLNQWQWTPERKVKG